MSAPVNTGRVISHVTKRDPKIDNDMLIKLAGGSDEQWGRHLKGPRAAAIVRACNAIMSEDNRALVSEGIHSEQWQLVTVAEKNRREAWFNLKRVDQHFKNAMKSVEAISTDHRASKRLRDFASAWLELFSEPRSEQGLAILKEWALELAHELEDHKPKLLKAAS